MITEQVAALKAQDQNQRETYAKLLAETEQRVVQANMMLAQA